MGAAPKIKPPITSKEIEQVLILRNVYEAQKKRLDMAGGALAEAELLERIQEGAPVISQYEVQIKTIERRNVAWKGIVCELIGAESAERILNQTESSITYRLFLGLLNMDLTAKGSGEKHFIPVLESEYERSKS